MLKVYLECYWGVDCYKRERQDLDIKISFLCETNWRRLGAHGNHLFHLILSFTTSVTNRCYCSFKTLSISVVWNGLFISICGAQQALFLLVAACFFNWGVGFCGVESLELVAQNHWKLIRSTQLIFDDIEVFWDKW